MHIITVNYFKNISREMSIWQHRNNLPLNLENDQFGNVAVMWLWIILKETSI